ncbi:MAG: type II secretion system GspH family protein [Coriobacteriales bacterium]|jgi:prepilin-type N-terminal cleavage/methylation domain-containing protein|nr:type II secretion system GspH family protein [Coriobacteriales bacterium]
MKELITKRLAQKARDKKGFTLIEVIVVLVILGILAAIAIPSLVGYIDKANQRTILAEAGTYRTALQLIGTDTVASGGLLDLPTGGSAADGDAQLPTDYMPVATNDSYNDELNALTGSNRLGNGASITNITYDANTGTLLTFTYSNGAHTAAYDNEEYIVS